MRSPRFSLHSPVVLRRAFTVVEGVVAVVIIAVLIGLLLPAYSRSRAISEATVCSDNLRRLGVATHAYAADHNGYIAPASLPGVGTLEDLLTPYIGPWIDKTRLIAADGFYCPTNVRLGSPPKEGYNTLADGRSGYKGWAGYMIGYRINASVHKNIPNETPRPLPLRMAEVRAPSKTFTLVDSNTRPPGAGGPPTSGFGKSTYLNPDHSSFGWFGDVHSGWCNILFVDGHVERFNRSRPLPIISLPDQETPWFP